MQSYELHVVSAHLKDRHPYLELPFNDRYDSTRVYHAVFDRSIPKLIEILEMHDLKFEAYRDAFITLTEMVSHQENKSQMIIQGLVEISSKFIDHHEIDLRRESMLVLGNNIIKNLLY